MAGGLPSLFLLQGVLLVLSPLGELVNAMASMFWFVEVADIFPPAHSSPWPNVALERAPHGVSLGDVHFPPIEREGLGTCDEGEV